MPHRLSLDALRTLGRSSLRISPICLGTAAFGPKLGQSADVAQARRIFDSYVDRGGNFIDAATPGGNAEKFIGEVAADKRDSLVIATKYYAATRPGDPPGDGGQSSRLKRSVEGSLRRLATDRIDLLYIQIGDGAMSPEAAAQDVDELVRDGKVRHVAIANAGGHITEMQVLADLQERLPLVALQVEYNEQLAHEIGLITTALDVGIVVSGAASTLGRTLLDPAVTALVVGVGALSQLEDHLAAFELVLSQQIRLEAMRPSTPRFPQSAFAR
jgi:aryl-alcohol dehydrogenase-like predicted oxidoreductase